MKIATKFSLRDVVVPVGQIHETIGDPCPQCEGTGEMALVKGGAVRCQNRQCWRGMVNRVQVHPWAVDTEKISEVGKISVEHWLDYGIPRCDVKYMIESTGVGSGRVWAEADLFATAQEARDECDRRNGVAATVVS